MLHHVVWYKLTDVSEELTASIIRAMSGGSKFLRNVGQFLPDYAVQHPKTQPSSYLYNSFFEENNLN
jgi:hypothetical protein